MTLKHIEFYDSPVMRELARQAVQKGTVTPKGMEELVKSAAEKKGETYEPSGDLFLDMVRLADGLRDKGYVKEAQSLEAKLLQYKSAAKEFADILDEAHPDGDFATGEGSKDLGDIETLESEHNKLEEIVKKVPTGKQAMVQSLLAAVGDILKTAQNAPQFHGDFGNDRLTQHLADVAKINGAVDRLLVDLNAGLETTRTTAISATAGIVFASDNVLGNDETAKLYATKAGIADIAGMDAARKTYKTVFAQATPSAKAVQAVIDNMDKAELTEYVTRHAPGTLAMLAQKFGPNDDPSKAKSITDTALDWAGSAAKAVLVPSVVTYLNDDSNKAAIAGAIYNEIVLNYNEYFEAGKLATATKTLQAEVEGVITAQVQLAKDEIAKIKKIDDPAAAQSNAIARGPIVKLIAELAAYTPDAATQALITSVIRAFTVPGVEQFLSARYLTAFIIPTLQKTADEIAAVELGTADKVPTIQEVGTVYAQFQNAKGALNSFIEAKGGESSQAGVESRPVLDQLDSLLGAISAAVVNNTTRPYYELFAGISAVMPTAKTFEQLAQQAAQYNQTIQNYVKTAGKVEQVVKNAAPPPAPGGAVAPAAGKPAAPAAPGAAKPGVTHDHRIMTLTAEEKTAVLEMQELLAEIAKYVSDAGVKTQLTTTGKNGNTTPDGAWLGYTSRALSAADALIKSWETTKGQTIGALELKQMGTKPNYPAAAAISAANKNSDTLRKYLQVAHNATVAPRTPGAPGAGATDKVLTYSSVEGRPITSTDLLSLKNFYEFLVRQKMASEEFLTSQTTTEPIRAIISSAFSDAMNKVLSDAQALYSKTKNDYTIAKYYQDAVRLGSDYTNLLNRFKISNEQPYIGYYMVQSFAGNQGSGGRGGNAGPGGVGHTGRGEGGKGSGRGADGEDFQIGDDFSENDRPIEPNGSINFKNPNYYGNLLAAFDEAPRVMTFNSFNSMHGKRIESHFGTQWRALQYLGQLGTAIRDAVNTWADNSDATMAEIARTQTLSERWLRSIDNKRAQIGVFNGQPPTTPAAKPATKTR